MKKIKLTKTPTPIEYYNDFLCNHIYIKRDDLTDLALGGNKVRKLELFLADALDKRSDCIVTYGSAQSNHCRLTAAAARKKDLKVVLILAKSDDLGANGNYFLYDLFDATIVWTETDEVPETIDQTLKDLENQGHSPYFIQGGGHGYLGTHAYKLAFDEIIEQQTIKDITFDCIFHASGTGTTQAGLVAGRLIHNSSMNIRGISVARKSPRGKQVVVDSLEEYLNKQEITVDKLENYVQFDDTYVGDGYADIYPEIIQTIKDVSKTSGILLDPVYTGKAFYGMLETIEQEQIKNQNILFIHTGGSPLLFNYAHMFKENH